MANGRNNSSKLGTDPRGAHVRMYWEILDSNAWRCLSATDQRAYLALQRQLRSTNTGDLSLPLSVARNSGIASPATLAKSLRALVAVGLLAVTRRGGCKKAGQRLPTLYRFTDHAAYANPLKFIDAAKVTNEWKRISTLGLGREAIRLAEAEAAKTQLQKLAHTASKNEVMGHLTDSNIEAWTPSPTSNIEAGEKSKTVRKANSGAGFKKSFDFSNSENHASNIEVLSTVATPTGTLGPPPARIPASRTRMGQLLRCVRPTNRPSSHQVARARFVNLNQ